MQYLILDKWKKHIFMENIIYNDLVRRGFNVDVGVMEYFPSIDGKTTRVQLEVDFVINRGSKSYLL